MQKYFDLRTKSLDELGVANMKDLWLKVKAEGYTALRTDVEVKFTKAENDNTYRFIFSTADEDRHGDVVMQDWDLKSYKKNPVVLDSHNYGSIFNILGKALNVGVKDGQLAGDIKFNPHTFEGMTAEAMVADEFVNAGSVGFIPKDFDEKGRIIKSELLEYSMVSVPANPKALREKYEHIKTNDADETSDEPTITPDSDGSEGGSPDVEQTSEPISGGKKRIESLSIRLAKELKRKEVKRRELFTQLQEAIAKSTPLNRAEKERKVYRDLRNYLSRDKS